jgi:hypothetical protein
MRTATILACIVALAWLCACTFVCIHGDGNTISDTCGHATLRCRCRAVGSVTA